ncbi:universal stress protein family protein [Desulfosarcina variabilis str. Montpellier]|uniref:universal stress protein n=1 Tax=Desulfosarcina variabilis TaxID=2300 RepID=UPI003AFB3A6F
MGQTKKILVAMASTEYSRGIFDFAATLATGLEAQLIIVNIINSRDIDAVRQVADMGYAVDGDKYVAGIKDARQQEIEAILRHSTFPKTRIQTILRVGNPVDELIKIAMDESVDMVVMGTKGRTDLQHILMGSVAEKMFRRSPVTIVSYRDAAQAEKLKKRFRF